MEFYVCMGAQLSCSVGTTPSSLMINPRSPLQVINSPRPLIKNQPRANILDHLSFVNILPFGMCHSPANPLVLAATSAALGVLTPMPCIPATTTPWLPAGNELISGSPALLPHCRLRCDWGGTITIDPKSLSSQNTLKEEF